MSIAGRQARKSTNKPAARRKTVRRGSSFKRTKSNWFVRLLNRIPSPILWATGIIIALVYIVFILKIVLHFSLPWKAMYGETVDPLGYEVRGIDVSHYQNSINWEVLKYAKINGYPVRFIMMKATEGATISDRTFSRNFKKAKENSFIRGAYHFFIPGTDAKAQANYFISHVKLKKGDLPPILDVEKSGGLSPSELREVVREWLYVVEDYYGVKPIIYTGYSFKMNYLNTDEFNDYPFWIAHYYVEELEYKGEWDFWQYTDLGRVPGIEGNVDCNVFNGSLEKLKQLTIK